MMGRKRLPPRPKLRSTTMAIVCSMTHHAPPGATRRWFRGVDDDGNEWFLIEQPEPFVPWHLKVRPAVEREERPVKKPAPTSEGVLNEG